MSQKDKLYKSVMSGMQDKNIIFTDLCKLFDIMEFEGRINGSHHIYYREDIPEILNFQPDGNMAKPYQVKQARNFIKKYDLEV